MTASALFPALHVSLISLTRDDSTRPVRVSWNRQSTSAAPVLARVAEGDPAAARECVDQFGDLIWSIARCLTRNRADAEDAVQEIFNDVWRTAGRFDPSQGSERVFVAMIARRRLIDRMRHAAHRDSLKPMDSQQLTWMSLGHGTEACAEALIAGRAVMQLRPELQRVLELGVLRGLSHSEISEVLKMPVGTVKSMMQRGLIQVRAWMGDATAVS